MVPAAGSRRRCAARTGTGRRPPSTMTSPPAARWPSGRPPAAPPSPVSTWSSRPAACSRCRRRVGGSSRRGGRSLSHRAASACSSSWRKRWIAPVTAMGGCPSCSADPGWSTAGPSSMPPRCRATRCPRSRRTCSSSRSSSVRW